MQTRGSRLGRALLPGLVCAAALLAAGHGRQARAGAAPALAPPGSVPWVLTAGTQADKQATVQCVPAGQAAPALAGGMLLHAGRFDRCIGSVEFSYLALDYLSVLGADIDGTACTTNTWYASCPVDLAVWQAATITTALHAGPYARGSTTVFVRGVPGGASWNIDFRTAGSLRVSQRPAFVIPSVGRSGVTMLSVVNSGPSGAKDVTVLERLPSPLSASSDDPACSFAEASRLLRCRWSHLDAGAKLSALIAIGAPDSTPAGQFRTTLQLASDLGTASADASFVVSGDIVAGLQDLPATATTQAEIVDTVSLHTLGGGCAGRAAELTPAHWSVHFPAGLQVLGVALGRDSQKLSCSYSDRSIRCHAPEYGSGLPQTNATASILLKAVQPGTQTVNLRWESPHGLGSTWTSVQVAAPAAQQPRAAGGAR